MTLIRRGLFWSLLVLMTTSLSGQDIHFTQFNLAPLTVNPALTGAFSGSFRLGGLYRDQWSSTYSTPAFYLDSPILKGFREMDWIGIGASVYQDKAQATFVPFGNGQSVVGSVKQGGLLGSAAYHLALDKERNTVIAVGIQGGTLSRSLHDEWRFEDAILSGSTTTERLPDSESPTSFLDVSGGITITGKTSGQSFYRIGFSMLHINNPRNAVLGSSGGAKLPRRAVGYATYNLELNEKILVIPSVLYQTIGPASEFSAQGMVGYKMPEQETVLKAGLGYRIGDALEVLLGVDYKDFRVGASYDLTLSDLAAPNNAFELAVAYIGRIYKRPKIDPVIFCPRF